MSMPSSMRFGYRHWFPKNPQNAETSINSALVVLKV